MIASTENLVLRRASQAQVHQTHLNHFESWGKKLTLDLYIRREVALGDTSFSKENIRVWVLCRETDPESLGFMCSCETYERPIRYSDSQDGTVAQGSCHSVASVFTPLRFRTKGYASLMMNKLAETLKSEGAMASALYSDIGELFYARLGWKVHPSISYNFNPKDCLENSPSLTTRSEVKFVTSIEDLSQILQRENARSLELLKNSPKPTVYMPFLVDCYVWYLTRSQFYAREFKLKTPTEFGATVGKSSFILWNHDLKDRSLLVLKCYAETQGEFDALVNCAMEEASSHDLPKLVLWNLDPKIATSSHFKAQVEKRKGSLGSLAFWGNAGNAVEWIGNENYAWV